MSCTTGACGRPDPASIRPGGFGPGSGGIHPNQRAHRRQTFHSPFLNEVSVRLRDPSLISFRDAVWAIFACFFLYKGYFAAEAIRRVMLVNPVQWVCHGQSALGCLWTHVWIVLMVVMRLAGETVPWGLVAAVVAFFGGEVVRSVKGKGGRTG